MGVTLSAQLAAQSVVPGLLGGHGLDETDSGELLIQELRCAACHEGISADGRGAIQAPRLDEAAWRISPEFLRSFIMDPAGSHDGVKMPDVLAHLQPTEREQAAVAISAFLTKGTRGFNSSFASTYLQHCLTHTHTRCIHRRADPRGATK
mgnify:CR=1 FL=1